MSLVTGIVIIKNLKFTVSTLESLMTRKLKSKKIQAKKDLLKKRQIEDLEKQLAKLKS